MVGTYSHNIDKKGRLTVPSKLREHLGECFMVTLGPDHCLFGYAMSDWEEMEAKVRQIPISKGRHLQRTFFGRAFEAECDSMGRILIPANLRKDADLQKETVIIGVGNRIEIWDKENWECADAEASALLLESMDDLIL